MCWLCPYLQALFKGVPDYLYVSWTAVQGPEEPPQSTDIERPFWWDGPSTGTAPLATADALSYDEWVEWEQRMDAQEANRGWF